MLDWPTLTLPPINLWNVPHSSNMSRIFMRRVGKHQSLVIDSPQPSLEDMIEEKKKKPKWLAHVPPKRSKY